MIEVRARVDPGYQANNIVLSMVDSDAFHEWEANLPPGYWWEIGGALFESRQGKSDLAVSLLISRIGVFCNV